MIASISHFVLPLRGRGRASVSDCRLTGSCLLLTLTSPVWAVTYSPVPASVPAGSPTFTLTINRSFTAGDEGYSADEMGTFLWYGPPNPSVAVPLPRATLVSLTQVR